MKMWKSLSLAMVFLFMSSLLWAVGQYEAPEGEDASLGGQREQSEPEIIEKSVPLYPLAEFPEVPDSIGVIRSDAKPDLSLEQQEVISTAFRRAYQLAVNTELIPGEPYNNDQVHFWWGRDPQSYMMSQNLGVDGESTGEGWGMPNFAIIAMHPTATQAFLIANEFVTQFATGREDEYGGNGPDGYGYPISDVYYTDFYKAQAFSKGLMIVEAGETEWIPEPVETDEVPEQVGKIREDNEEKYSESQQAAITAAFRREYRQAMIREFNIGEPASPEELVHEWGGRDVAPVMQSFVNGDSTGEGWGMPKLTIMMMDPDSRRCFIIKDEFVTQYSTGREDEYGGNGPDGYGYPTSNEYKRFGYTAQAFEKGLMILEEGEIEFIPNAEYE